MHDINNRWNKEVEVESILEWTKSWIPGRISESVLN